MAESSEVAEHPSPTPPRSTLLTFLIADVRGYTRFTVDQGDEAAAKLAGRFAELCQEVVTAHEGRVIELRGDEALAAFASARYALHAAIALQNAFRDVREHDPSLPLQVGMGLDAGDAIPIAGGYRGGALNLAARLCSIAGAGDVFCSQTVIGLARKTNGITFVDRGEVTLKGLSSPVRVIQVAPEGEMVEELPPLQPILVTHPNNLPDEVTPFIGREAQIEQITTLLRDPHIRMVTLTGPGGTGKTRLALQVGSILLHDFRNGAFFVNLAPLVDPTLLPTTIAEVLGVREEPGTVLLETLTHVLREKHLLLVLDNYEHLLDAAPLVGALLDACRGLHVLATSRIPLHLSREHEYPVRPLSLPDPQRLPDAESLSQYEAVAFFIERARAVRPDFTVTNENAPAVAEICVRLDGLPLAIELATARLKLFAPQALLQRLNNRLKLLTGGAKDRPTRQQTLRGAIDWSYSLLTEEQQRLFARLSVFAGGCTLEGAEAVCDAEGDLAIEMLEGIASLVDKSLLRQDPHRVPAPVDDPRFVMLQTLHEYATERLEAGGEAEQIHLQHAAYFITLAEEAEGNMLGAIKLREWLDRLEAEHDNLREAIGWLRRTDRGTEALRIAGALYPFWNARGYWREGRRWLEEALSVGATAPDAVRAKALYAVGTIAGVRHGDYPYARARLEESLTLWHKAVDATRMALTLTSLANVAFLQGDEQWRDYYVETLAHVQEVPPGPSRAAISFNLGLVVYQAGDRVEAQRLFEQGLGWARETGHELYTASALGWLARFALDQGDLPRARSLAQKSVDLAHRGHYMLALMFGLETFAGIAGGNGQAELAARLYGAIEALQQTTGGLLLPQILAIREPLIDAGTARIGEDAWTRAWEQGRAMSLEMAVACAAEITI